VEEGILLRTLAFSCGHGYAQEEYAIKREHFRTKCVIKVMMSLVIGA